MRDLHFGIGTLHLAVLRARYQQRPRFRRRLHLAGLLLMVLVLVGISGRPLVQVLYGQGTLVVQQLSAGAQLSSIDRALDPHGARLPPGDHTVTVTQAGHYPRDLPLTITRAQTTTVTVPPLRPRPQVQPIPLPATGTAWHRLGRDGADGWRVQTRTSDATRTVFRLDTQGLHPRLAPALTVVDTIPTAAGPVTAQASWSDTGWQRTAILDITTSQRTVTLTPTQRIAHLAWAPTADTLLIAQETPQGLALHHWQDGQRELGPSLGQITGELVTVHWHPTGQAALVLSAYRQDEAWQWAGTLVRFDAATSTQLTPPPRGHLGLTPFAWDADGLLWVGQVGSGAVIEHLPLDTGLPTRLGSLDTPPLALRRADATTLHLLQREADDQLTLVRWVDGQTTRLFALDDVTRVDPTQPVRGLWHGTTLLLGSGTNQLWTLTFDAEAFQ